MSKMFFFGFPAHGHINPSLPLVRELVQRGEQVIYYASDEFKEKIERVGAQFRSYGEKSQQLHNELEGKHGNLILLSFYILKIGQAILPDAINDLETDKPDYIIYDSMALWGKFAAQMMKLPAVCSNTIFVMSEKRLLNPKVFFSFAQGLPYVFPFFLLSRRLAAMYQIPRLRLRQIFIGDADLTIVYTSRCFQPDSHQLDKRYRFIGPSIPGESNLLCKDMDFPAKGDIPLIYISLGTVFNNNTKFYNECIRAYKNMECRVIMSVGNAIDLSALKDIPKNFTVRRHVPQMEVLKRADLFITHGGMNSVSEALFLGVPMIVVPMAADQPIVAVRVKEVGAGIYLKKGKVKHKRLQSLSAHILSDQGYKRKSKAVGDSLRASGGPTYGADEIIAYKNRQLLKLGG